jgi:hypothetical protein
MANQPIADGETEILVWMSYANALTVGDILPIYQPVIVRAKNEETNDLMWFIGMFDNSDKLRDLADNDFIDLQGAEIQQYSILDW